MIRPHVVVHRHLKASFREPSAETRSLSALAPRQLQMSILMTTTRSLELCEVPPIDLGHEAIIKDRCAPLKKQRCVSADPWGQHIYIYIYSIHVAESRVIPGPAHQCRSARCGEKSLIPCLGGKGVALDSARRMFRHDVLIRATLPWLKASQRRCDRTTSRDSLANCDASPSRDS